MLGLDDVINYLKGERLQDCGLSFGVVGEIGDGAEKMLQGLKALTRKWNCLQNVFRLKGETVVDSLSNLSKR